MSKTCGCGFGFALILTLCWVGTSSASPLAVGDWNHVARIADDGGGMFDGDGQLLSTYSYGTKTANALTQNSDFQIAFDVYDAMEILFITGDEQVWGKTRYADLRTLIDAFGGEFLLGMAGVSRYKASLIPDFHRTSMDSSNFASTPVLSRVFSRASSQKRASL